MTAVNTKTKIRRIVGAVAQLGERYNGIVEVVGSIPSGSTRTRKISATLAWESIQYESRENEVFTD